jgi:serine/threonine protein kinase
MRVASFEHRDGKPSNIVIDRAGQERVFLLDFGLDRNLGYLKRASLKPEARDSRVGCRCARSIDTRISLFPPHLTEERSTDGQETHRAPHQPPHGFPRKSCAT